ncbi:hypothetical protein CRG98_003248, partial [Punica granatum]
MGEPRSSNQDRHDALPAAPAPPPPPPRQPVSLVQPSQKKRHKPKVFRVFRSVFRSFPIITPVCKLPSLPMGLPDTHRTISGSR